MFTYYAIAQREGQWSFICAGTDPETIYREAMNIVESHDAYPEEELFAYAPETERLLDTLRIVPEETAREYYHVVYPSRLQVDE